VGKTPSGNVQIVSGFPPVSAGLWVSGNLEPGTNVVNFYEIYQKTVGFRASAVWIRGDVRLRKMEHRFPAFSGFSGFRRFRLVAQVEQPLETKMLDG